MDALKKDLYLLGSALLQLLLMIFCSLLMPTELSRGEGEAPLPRQLVASVVLPRIDDWGKSHHVLSVDRLELIVSINDTKLTGLPAIDLSQPETIVPLGSDAELRINIRAVNSTPYAGVAATDELITVELHQEFLDTPEDLPRRVTMFLRVITEPAPAGMPAQVEEFWHELAAAYDRGDILSEGVACDYPHHATAMAACYPEGNQTPATFASLIYRPNLLKLHLASSTWLSHIQRPSVIHDLASAIGSSPAAVHGTGISYGLPSPPVTLTGPLQLDFVYEANFERAEVDDDEKLVPLEVHCRFHPTLKTPF